MGAPMRVSGSSIFPIGATDLWKRLNDPDVLARCAPGCEELQKADDGRRYRARLKIGIGAIKGSYRCELELSELTAPGTYGLLITGHGPLGSVDGRIRVRLDGRADGSTTLAYEGDVEVGGVIATVGYPVLKSVADFQTKQFFDALQREILRGRSPGESRAPAAPEP